MAAASGLRKNHDDADIDAWIGRLTARFGRLKRLSLPHPMGRQSAILAAYFEKTTCDLFLRLDGAGEIKDLTFTDYVVAFHLE